MAEKIDKRACAGLTVIVLAAALAASGAVSSSLASSRLEIDVLPTPKQLPASTVAVVSHVPLRLRTITIAGLARAMSQSAVEFGLKSAPASGQPKYKAVEEKALGEQFDAIWIQGQAAEMGIAVTRKEVTAELAQIKKENFKSEKQYHAFLKHAHYTRQDVLNRVRLQLLSTKIEEQVARSVKSPQEVKEVFSAFVAEYRARWRSRTVCAARYAIERCSNGAASG
jgi:SurA-like protein